MTTENTEKIMKEIQATHKAIIEENKAIEESQKIVSPPPGAKPAGDDVLNENKVVERIDKIECEIEEIKHEKCVQPETKPEPKNDELTPQTVKEKVDEVKNIINAAKNTANEKMNQLGDEISAMIENNGAKEAKTQVPAGEEMRGA